MTRTPTVSCNPVACGTCRRRRWFAAVEWRRAVGIEGIKRWVEYIESEPPETWGPQQNAVVNDQLGAAQSVWTSADHQQHVKNVAAEILDVSDESDDDPE